MNPAHITLGRKIAQCSLSPSQKHRVLKSLPYLSENQIEQLRSRLTILLKQEKNLAQKIHKVEEQINAL